MSEKNKVLIIEDNREHLVALAIKLKANGYDVVSASDGATAMSVTLKEKPDAILLDLGLPAGDGFVVLERLKTLVGSVTTPVIVVSAREPNVNRPRALQGGATAFLQKPVKTEELLRALHDALFD
jgi:two-component system KDP operon response regulator KdpE